MTLAFVFDLDGVLVDTAELHYLAWKQVADEEGVAFSREDNEARRGIPRRESLHRLLKGRSVSQAEGEELMARKNAYYQARIGRLAPGDLLPGVDDLLSEIRAAGLRIAVASSSKNAAQVVEALGLRERIDLLCDGFSVERPKPAPDLFLFAAGRLGVNPGQCIAVEDAAAGVQAAVKGLDENLRLQDRTAQRMRNFRHLQGALSLETSEARPVFDGDQLRALEREEKNRAKEIIEDFMVAANGVTAGYLSARNFPSIRRVVRTPRRWDRIVAIARQREFRLPDRPDSRALEEFLVNEKTADPQRFPDLSLAVIKLLGAGEYIAQLPEGNASGHFGLAVKDYAHSTAPNRRYPDLLTQRLLKAAIDRQPVPYHQDELDVLAAHCTKGEDAANKVERQVRNSAAALLLESRIGEPFDSIVTGASEKGTWVRLLTVPVEGKLVHGFEGADVGDRIRVRLTSLDVERGFIDFRRLNSS